jgi:hypothetical protein
MTDHLSEPLAIAATLDRIAKRIADALYYDKLGPIGNGHVSPGLLHDDYDRLRAIASQLRRTEYLRLADLEMER